MKSLRSLCLFAVLLSTAGCRKAAAPDRPYVAEGVVMQDVTFHSQALNREMPYRVFMPRQVSGNEKLPVIYLLHGGNGSFRDWSNDSQVSTYAARGIILVMPEGAFSYLNAVRKPQDRYEDYTFIDLVNEVESRFPAARTRNKRAIVGISMGGFAAIKIALTRPDLFGFVGAFSPSVDFPRRRIKLRRDGEWWRSRTIFGPWDSEERNARDPFLLVKTADPAKTPFIYMTSGNNEPLLEPDRRFAARLNDLHFSYEFHIKPGGHDWTEWNSQIQGCFESLFQHLDVASHQSDR